MHQQTGKLPLCKLTFSSRGTKEGERERDREGERESERERERERTRTRTQTNAKPLMRGRKDLETQHRNILGH